jgi:hypothetical protein
VTSRSGNDTDGYHAHIKEHTSTRNDGHNDRQHLAAVGGNSGDAKCQSQRKAGHYQQSSKDRERTASARPKYGQSNDSRNGYGKKNRSYFPETHF